MKKILQLEETALFAACLMLFPYFGISWWWFAALILTPDVGMVGYIWGNKVGAITYNVFHHRAVALLTLGVGVYFLMPALQIAGYILFTHTCFDRMLGYGLKHFNGFKSTHLGMIGGTRTDHAT